MKLDRCMRLCAFMVLLFSIGSVLISAVIVSSDTLNNEPNTPILSNANVPKQEIPIESDKNGEKLFDTSEQSKTDKENLNFVKSVDISSDEISDINLISEQKNDEQKEKEEEEEEEERRLETSAESQLELPNLNQAEVQGEQEIKNDDTNDNNVDAVPTGPGTASISVNEETKELLIETPLVKEIDDVFPIKNDSNETDQQQLNASQIPTDVETSSSSEAGTVQSAESSSSTEHVVTDENKTASNDSIVEKPPLNLTVEENQIPVFSEWAQKRLEEVEKEVEQEVVNTSTMKKNTPSMNKPQVLKLKSAKNYASPDCGAKIIAAHSESSGTGYVLTSTKDEYMLSPCKSRIWFVVELCEAIQAERIDLANFELFSSSPKNFSVAVSSRFPTRDWSNVGKFIAKDERYIQSFDLYPHLFGKYVRVDIHSHYNSEHFCPISLFRVYGTSEFEAFETENRQHPIDDLDVDEEDDQESVTKSKSNIFQSASEAVMSIVDTVKKAAQFVKPHGNKTTDSISKHLFDANTNNCITLNYAVHCENCTEQMTSDVNAISECKQQLLQRLLNIDIIKNSLYKSQMCANLIGIDLNINCSEPNNDTDMTSAQLTDLQMEYITHLFSLKYITAMCNLLAANDRKFAWNSTIPLSTTTTTTTSDPLINITIDKNAGNLLSHDGIKQNKNKEKNQIVPKEPIPNDKLEINENPMTEVVTEPQFDVEDVLEKINVVSTENGITSESSKTIESKNGSQAPNSESTENTSNEQSDQNIFNVVQSTENNVEIVDQTPQIDNIAPIKPEIVVKPAEQAPSNVIILPDATQTNTATTTQTPAEINDVSDEQVTNGWANTQQFGQKLHSESVFLRLSNRVKALERNMSLSGQYLEELSRGYKKQVEELQLSFAKTLVNIEEQSRRNLERKQELFEQNEKLRNELDILTERIFSWKNILICCACFTCVQIVIFHVILKIWGRKYGLERSSSIDVGSIIAKVDAQPRKRKSGNVPVKFRRKSAEEKRERNLSESSVSALQRRPSTEALNIMGTYTELLIDDTNKDQQLNDSLKDSSNEQFSEDINGYVRIEDLRNMYEKPESDYEFYGPAPELKGNDTESYIEECGSESTNEHSSPQQRKQKSIKINNKNKNRRVSSPSFFKSPFSSGSPAQSTGWEWHRSKKYKSSQIGNKKSKSESPPSIKQNGLNNNSVKLTSNSRHSTPGEHTNNDSARSSISSSTFDNDKKSTGSFKRLLKKIF